MARKKSKKRSHHHPHSISNGAPPSGFIFTCDRITKPECFRSVVFGLRRSKIESVMSIEPGAYLFLFDCELRILYGVYRAASHGGANLVPHAFGGKFPAQVKFWIERDCYPLPESVFKHAIQENYSKAKFRPGLDYQQVNRLLSLFQDTMVPPKLPPVDSRYAHQTVRPPVLTDPRYFPSAAPPPPQNNQYYAAPSYYPAQPPSLPASYQHYDAPPKYPAQPLPVPPKMPPPSHQYYPAPPNDPYYQGGSTQNYYPGNAVPA